MQYLFHQGLTYVNKTYYIPMCKKEYRPYHIFCGLPEFPKPDEMKAQNIAPLPQIHHNMFHMPFAHQHIAAQNNHYVYHHNPEHFGGAKKLHNKSRSPVAKKRGSARSKRSKKYIYKKGSRRSPRYKQRSRRSKKY